MYESQFKALGEPTRMIIVKLLADRELGVSELEKIMQISQPRISQHLKVLKQSGLIEIRREGQQRICKLNWPLLEETVRGFMTYIGQPLEEIAELKEVYARMKQIF